MVQVMNKQNVKIEVTDFEQMQKIVWDLTASDFNVSATIQGKNWLIVADRELPQRVTGQIDWRPAVSSGTYIGTGGVNET